jgi:selenocysteine lyase/cysteine desulfurase
MNLASEGVSVDFIETDKGAYSVEEVERALRPQTRVLSVSWVHFLSGFRADLESIGALCQEQDVLFCVDAIQGLGVLRLDVKNAGIDFLASGGHKWLMSTQGIGILYCEESLQKQIQPPSGWLHGPIDWAHLDQYDLTFHDDARRFRTGTFNSTGVVALDSALGLYLEAGPRWCERRVLDLSARLADGLERRGLPRYGTGAQEHASGIVTIAPDDPEQLVNHLKEQNVTVALRNRKVRFSPTYYNDESDLRAVFEAVDSFQH